MRSARTGTDPGAGGPATGTTKTPPSPGTRRRLALAAGAAVLVAALVAVLLLVTGNDDGSAPAAPGSAAPSTSPAEATAAEAPAATPAPEVTGQAQDPEELPPALPAVALDAPGPVGDGVVITLASIEAIHGSAQGPGNVAGPALRVTVRITNGSDSDVALDGVAVNLSYGAEATPASPLDDASQRPFTGGVPRGEEAEGVYVFSVPAGARESVTVDVGYRPGAPRVLFTGRAS
jgi:hypothetical protein